MNKVGYKARKLRGKFSDRITRYYGVLWNDLAKHVLIGELKARVNELEEIHQEVTSANLGMWDYSDRISELKAQIKELEDE